MDGRVGFLIKFTCVSTMVRGHRGDGIRNLLTY